MVHYISVGLFSSVVLAVVWTELEGFVWRRRHKTTR